jgi:amphi-Trp domain-containing protein
MPEETLFTSESVQSRADIAAYLRQVADTLEAGGEITLRAGGESITMNPPESLTFEVEAEREGPTGQPGELSIEFELEWDENQSGGSGGGGPLEIE